MLAERWDVLSQLSILPCLVLHIQYKNGGHVFLCYDLWVGSLLDCRLEPCIISWIVLKREKSDFCSMHSIALLLSSQSKRTRQEVCSGYAQKATVQKGKWCESEHTRRNECARGRNRSKTFLRHMYLSVERASEKEWMFAGKTGADGCKGHLLLKHEIASVWCAYRQRSLCKLERIIVFVVCNILLIFPVAQALEKARTLSADVIAIDLEDAVAPEVKVREKNLIWIRSYLSQKDRRSRNSGC